MSPFDLCETLANGARSRRTVTTRYMPGMRARKGSRALTLSSCPRPSSDPWRKRGRVPRPPSCGAASRRSSAGHVCTKDRRSHLHPPLGICATEEGPLSSFVPRSLAPTQPISPGSSSWEERKKERQPVPTRLRRYGLTRKQPLFTCALSAHGPQGSPKNTSAALPSTHSLACWLSPRKPKRGRGRRSGFCLASRHPRREEFRPPPPTAAVYGARPGRKNRMTSSPSSIWKASRPARSASDDMGL